MRDPMAQDLRRDGKIVRRKIRGAVGALHHLGQGFEPLQHLIHRDAIIDQTGDFTHADALELLHPLQRVLYRAEKAAFGEIAFKGEI